MQYVLTEKNVNGERQHLCNSFKKPLKKTWTKETLTTCTSTTNTTWKGDYKSGGTSITLTGRLSSAVKNKRARQLRVRTFTTILEKNNNKTTISNVYRLGNIVVELVGNSTVMKQQWILLKQSSTKGHPHGVIINV